jgi:hypothetical protein
MTMIRSYISKLPRYPKLSVTANSLSLHLGLSLHEPWFTEMPFLEHLMWSGKTFRTSFTEWLYSFPFACIGCPHRLSVFNIGTALIAIQRNRNWSVIWVRKMQQPSYRLFYLRLPFLGTMIRSRIHRLRYTPIYSGITPSMLCMLRYLLYLYFVNNLCLLYINLIV